MRYAEEREKGSFFMTSYHRLKGPRTFVLTKTSKKGLILLILAVRNGSSGLRCICRLGRCG